MHQGKELHGVAEGEWVPALQMANFKLQSEICDMKFRAKVRKHVRLSWATVAR